MGGAGLAAASGLIIAGIDIALYIDPPDSNYQQIAQLNLLQLPPLLVSSEISPAEASAYNALLLNLEHQIALLNVIITSINRAQSASEAGSTFWEAQQVNAITSYSNQLGGYLAAEPTLLTNLTSAILSNGDPIVPLTASQVLAFEQSLVGGALGGGLPPAVVNDLKLLGADSATIADVQELYTVQNINTVASTGGFPTFFTTPSLLSSLTGSATSIGGACSQVDLVRAAIGSKLGQAGYIPAADLNHDGIVNIIDLAIAARSLPAGTRCP